MSVTYSTESIVSGPLSLGLSALPATLSYITGPSGPNSPDGSHSELENALRVAQQQQTAELVDAILRANSELTGEALTQRINEELAIRRRFNLLPQTGSVVAGFQSVQGARF